MSRTIAPQMFEGVGSYSHACLGCLDSLVPASEHTRESALLLRNRLRAWWRRGVHEEVREVRRRSFARVRGLTRRWLLAGTRSRLALLGDLRGVVGAGAGRGGRVGRGDGGVFLGGGGGVLREGRVAREGVVAREH